MERQPSFYTISTLLIQKENVKDIYDYLKQQYQQGDRFVSYPDNTSVTKQELRTFPDRFGALQSIYDHSTDIDSLSYKAIGSVTGNLKKIISEQDKNKVMNEKNFEYLTNQLEKTGFGNTLNTSLKGEMEKGSPEFQLKLNSQYGPEKNGTEATLHFRKGNEIDMYFFNKYNLELKGPDKETIRENTFYVNKGNTVTLKEGYNLLEGQSVNKDLTNKEGEKYNAWVELDLSKKDKYGNYEQNQYNQKYGFNLEKELGKLPIKEMENDRSREYLINGLKKGNDTQVTLTKDGGEQRVSLEVNPKDRSVTVNDKAAEQSKDVIAGKEQTQNNAKEKENVKEAKPDVVKDFFDKKDTAKSTVKEQGIDR